MRTADLGLASSARCVDRSTTNLLSEPIYDQNVNTREPCYTGLLMRREQSALSAALLDLARIVRSDLRSLMKMSSLPPGNGE